MAVTGSIGKGLLYVLAQMIPALAAIVTLALYTRWLSAEAYGIYSTLLVLVTAANLALFNWLYVGVYRFWNDGQLSERDLQAVTVLALLVVSLLVLVSATLAAILSGQYQYISAFAALLICSALFSTCQRINAITQQARQFLYAETLKVMIASSVGVYLVWRDYSWPGIIVGLCLGFIGVALLSASFRHMLFIRPQINTALLKRLLVYGMPLSLTFVLLEIIHASDRILLTWLLGADYAGRYAAAFSLPNQLLLMLANAVAMALYPQIIQQFEQDKRQPAAYLSHYLLILSGVLLPAWLGLIAIRHDFLPLILGAEFINDALWLLPWLGLAVLLNCLYLFYVSYSFQLSQQTSATIRIVFAAAILNSLLNILLIPLLGLLGAAIATIAAYAVCVLYGFLVGQRYCSLPLNWPALCQIGLSALLMLLVLELLPLDYGWQQGLMRIGAGIVVYTGLILLLDIGGIRSIVSLYYRKLMGG